MLKESQILKTLNPVTVFSTSFKPALVHLLIYFFIKQRSKMLGGAGGTKRRANMLSDSFSVGFHNNLNTVTETLEDFSFFFWKAL